MLKTNREPSGSGSLSVLSSLGWKKPALLSRRERGKNIMVVVFVVLVCVCFDGKSSEEFNRVHKWPL